MGIKIVKFFSAVDVCRNLSLIIPDTMQRIKKIGNQTAFCKRGRMQTGYRENAIRRMLADRFRAEYRGKP